MKEYDGREVEAKEKPPASRMPGEKPGRGLWFRNTVMKLAPIGLVSAGFHILVLVIIASVVISVSKEVCNQITVVDLDRKIPPAVNEAKEEFVENDICSESLDEEILRPQELNEDDDSDVVTNSPLKGKGVYDTIGIGGGCGGGRGRRGGGVARISPPPGPAHGGSRPPNAEPYDATFFKSYGVNPFVDAEDDHLSTFATDIDTASYTIARAYLKDGNLPPNEAIRTEEFVNFFDYNYQPPAQDAFAIHLEAAPSKFGKNCFLQRIGIRGKEITSKERKDAVLTFVIDVSGSMGDYDSRLELVKKSLRLLIDQLREGDRIGIVVYTTRARILMTHKGLSEKAGIIAAIDSLHSEDSTNAEDGLRMGFEMANKEFRKDSINRIILCTDGVANEGQTGAEEILKEIKPYTDKGIYLSAIGFGMDNYNDVLLQKLGDKGNGHYAYVDNITEAKRVFVENLTGTLQVIAKDVKVQVDFNPAVVRSYRLLGYEKRDVADNKFRDDKEDGGEIGTGFSVTALYEIKLWGDNAGKSADNPANRGKIATLYIRAKNPDNGEVREIAQEINTTELKKTFEQASDGFKLSAVVAQFAEILRQSYWAKDEKIGDVLELAQGISGGYKNDAKVIELIDLISKAKNLLPKELAKSGEKTGD